MTTERELPLRTSDHVTHAELKATCDPMIRGIRNIEKVVVDLPLIRAQVEQTNGEVAKHTKEIGVLNKWRLMAMGGGAVVAFALGGGGITYILTVVME